MEFLILWSTFNHWMLLKLFNPTALSVYINKEHLLSDVYILFCVLDFWLLHIFTMQTLI